MDPIERVSHPSPAQLEILVQFLEEHPSLAKGYLRNAGAKAKAIKEWEILTLKLNSIGGGALKSVKKWNKYWADKKSAVKKKASARAVAMRRTGGGVEEFLQLTEIEERIVALMGGGAFATGDAHLRIQVFDEPTHHSNSSPSILANQIDIFPQPGPSTSVPNNTPSLYDTYVENADLHLDPRPPEQPPQQPALVDTPQRENPEVMAERRNVNASGLSSNSPTRRRTLIRRSPPNQRRSHFVSITDKFLRIEEQRLAFEEQRLAFENRLVTVMEQNLELNRRSVEAFSSIGDGLKALAEAIKKKD